MIKMRINQNEESICEECGVHWNYTSCMYDIMLIDTKHTICSICADTLFSKLLKAQCMQNAKIKNQQDLKRINNENVRKYKKGI